MIQCPAPRCGGTLFAGLVALTSYRLRPPWYWPWGKSRLERWTSGQRVACQTCGTVFSIGPDGVFAQAPNALPYSPQPQAARAPVADAQGVKKPDTARAWETEAQLRGRMALTPLEAPDV